MASAPHHEARATAAAAVLRGRALVAADIMGWVHSLNEKVGDSKVRMLCRLNADRTADYAHATNAAITRCELQLTQHNLGYLRRIYQDLAGCGCAQLLQVHMWTAHVT